MSKVHRSFVVLALCLVTAGFLIGIVVFAKYQSEPTDYEALIDQAILTKNAELCEGVKETTRPGPTDGPMKISGQEAVDWCKQQVGTGQRILGG